MWLCGSRAPRIKINKVFKRRVKIARALEGEGVAYSVWINVMFEVVLKLFSECDLRSFSMPEFVDKAWGRGDKISEVRIEGVINVSNENIWAEARSWGARRVIPVDNGGCMRLQWIEFMHPSCRLGMFVREDVGNLSVRVFGNSCTCSSSKAVPH